MADTSKRKSPVWEFYEATESTAKCKLCKKVLKRSKGCTSNLLAHMQRDHRVEHQTMKDNEERRKAEVEQDQQVRSTSHVSNRLSNNLSLIL